MTRAIEDLVSRVQGAQPTANEWARVSARIEKSLASMPVSASLPLVGSPFPSPTPGSWSAWKSAGALLGGGIAVGLVWVGLAASSSSPASPTGFHAQAVRDAQSVQMVWASEGAATPGAERWVRSDRVARGEVQRRPAGGSPALEPSVGFAAGVELKGATSLGESDVEYDRRHLVPVDAALQARRPARALELLAAFVPRKLTTYASALKAVALCDAGRRARGVELGNRVLPNITNGGLERRVRTACKIQ